MSNYNSDSVKVWCTILEERVLSLRIEQKQARDRTLEVWVPRSQLNHISKRPKPMDTKIEMPEWLAENKGLDYD